MFQILIVVAIVILDRVTKYYAITYLKDIGSIEIVKGIFSLTYVENRGAAFGILQNQRWFLLF